MDYAFSSMGPALHVLALIVLFVFLLAGLGLAIALAALPGQIAARRGHPQTEAINICGWVGFPTGAFWIIALVWAFWRPAGTVAEMVPHLGSLTSQLDKLEETVTRLEQQRKGAV